VPVRSCAPAAAVNPTAAASATTNVEKRIMGSLLMQSFELAEP
jgi:hypothetical protein